MTLKTTQSSAKEIAEEYANKIFNQKEIITIDRLVNKDIPTSQIIFISFFVVRMNATFVASFNQRDINPKRIKD